MYAIFADKNDNIDEQIVSIPGATVLLHCPMNLSASQESWSKGYQILSQGNDISSKLSQSRRLNIISDEDRSYSLEITNITKSDVGIYCCNYEMDTAYQHCTDLDVIDEPFCLPENIFDGINGEIDQMTLTANIYNKNISEFNWWTGKKTLFNDDRYEFYSNVSFTEKELFGNIINVTVTKVCLKISNLTSEDFNRNYTVTVKYDNRNLTCTYELPAEEVPETPAKLEVKLDGTGIRLSWVSKTSKAFQYPITFYIKYKSCDNDTCQWKTLKHNHNSQHSMSIFNLSESTDYYIVMYAENVFGKSNETDIITIKTGRIRTINRCHGQISRGHGQVSRGHGQVSRGHGQVIRGHGQVSRGHGQVNHGNGPVSRSHGQVSRGQELENRCNGQVSRGHGQVSHGHGQASRGQELENRCNGQVSRGHGLVSRGHGQVSHGHGQVSRGHGQEGRRHG
ncbi:Hypothetical predicted protein [Mytilus galloprovincialis]|uniref:Fibronectin type-III domain-containing protein n=1 Tax=Mytilus galloprovincialis TaxID=29158 RepID=A0A8B6FGE0_MYTGA|nr:Hypothetical predicted protein [Mytilus galloprovincialis]